MNRVFQSLQKLSSHLKYKVKFSRSSYKFPIFASDMKNVQYISSDIFTPKDSWGALSLEEKAAIIRAGVEEGLTDLSQIRAKYNEFAQGGQMSEEQYLAKMEQVAVENYLKWGFNTPEEALTHVLNDNTYDYRGYYNKYPYSSANADTHWTDEFKTVYHPTFSIESIYSGQKSQFNPEGLVGGHWEGEQFVPADWQKKQFQEGGSKPTSAPIDSAFMASRPSPWDIAARAALNYSNTVLGHEFPITVKESPIQPAPINAAEVRQRQAFMETAFNDKAVSPTGAKGRWQIMPNTLAEYTKATGKTGDLNDSDFNGEVRDWYLDKLLSRNWVTKGDASDSIQWGKALAAYNYGPTNTVNALNKAKTSGADIYGSWAWLDHMPEETRNYVNFILRNQDINKHKNQSEYDKAVNKQKKNK